MNLQGELKSLTKYFAQALSHDSTLDFRGDSAEISLKLRIGESVTINHTLRTSLRVDRAERPEEFRKLNRSFLLQLFEAKQK